MRLKFDENMPQAVCELFRDLGFDAHTIYDEDMQGAEEFDIAKVCHEEGRILVTMDRGFGDLRVFEPGLHPGIIFLRSKAGMLQAILALAQIVAEELRQRDPAGTLWILTDGKIRISRGLPR